MRLHRSRLGEERFGIVTGTAFGNHDLSWIRAHLPADGSVEVTDVTARWACFGLWGPRAREILAPLTPDALDFGYMRLREITVGDVPVRALRVTYVGELGWELYCPTEYGAGLWRTLHEAGRRSACAPAATGRSTRCGSRRAIACGVPTSRPTTRRSRRGSGSACAPTRSSSGQTRCGDREPARRLRAIALDDARAVALGNEPVRVGGEVVGRVTSGGYGYTVARSIAYAYLPAEVSEGADVEIDIFGEWVGGRRLRASRCSTPKERGSAREGRRERVSAVVRGSRPGT